MILTGETLIPAPAAKVWAGLNDPEVLRRCIPGCEALESVSPTQMTARVVQKIGPVSASFAGEVTLSDFDPPHSYRITGQGSGGVAGFAKGSALIRLTEEAGGTRLVYEVDVAVGGKIAQLGARMIKGVADGLAKKFFDAFSQAVTGGLPAPVKSTAVPSGAVGSTRTAAAGSLPARVEGPGWRLFALAGWGTAAVFALLALILSLQHP
jgi:carbon monoxide dehydrogenase subunit G